MTIRDKITHGQWRFTERSEVTGIPSAQCTIPFAIEAPKGGCVIPIADICNFPPATESQTSYQKANALAISKVPEMLEIIQIMATADSWHDIAPFVGLAKQLWEELNKQS